MPTKKIIRKNLKKFKANKAKILHDRLQEEVNALTVKPVAAALDINLPPDKQKLREELLAEIEATENIKPVETKAQKSQSTSAESQPQAGEAGQAISFEVTSEKLKAKLLFKRFHKKLWLWLPLLALIIYGGFYVLRLDKIYPAVRLYLPWPAVWINGHIIWLDDLSRETELVTRFKITSKPEQLALNHLIEEQIIKAKFVEYNLKLPPELVAKQLKDLIQEFGSDQSFYNYINLNYGLNASQFSQLVLTPYLKRLTLQEYLSHNPKESAEAEAKALAIKQKLDNNEITFAEAAKLYSDDLASAAQGGSLGWFTWGAMMPEFEAVLRNLAVGEVSAPVRSALGYHLLRLDEIDGFRPTNHNDTNLGNVKASHIFILVINFDNWLAEQKKASTKIQLVPLKN